MGAAGVANFEETGRESIYHQLPYVGLDVHKGSFDIAVAGSDGEVRHAGSIGGDLVALGKSLRKVISHCVALHVQAMTLPNSHWTELKAYDDATRGALPMKRFAGVFVTVRRRVVGCCGG